MGFTLLAVPIIAVMLFVIIRKSSPLHWVSLSASVLLLLAAVFLTRDVMAFGRVEYTAFGRFFYVDSLSIIILDLVLSVGAMAGIFSVGYLKEEVRHGKVDEARIRLYYILMHSFMFTMIFALTVNNMGLMWIAIEGTTLASAFLVGFYNNKQAIEAAWKYVIICSVGIAIALLGIIFLHLASAETITDGRFLEWTALFENARALKGSVLRVAFIFILIGFGTKAGFAPMHTWLPDAHSQAPSPISALLSGVLLNSAMYGIIRTVAIVNKNLGSSVFTGRLLMAAGLLSIITAAVFILTQKDYKRLLAYSSIEHMGIIVFAMGIFTPAAVFGALFHMINHSFTKSMLFLASGNVLLKYNTREISKVHGILKLLPVSGPVFLLGLFAIAGTPPFSVFASEWGIMTAAFDGGHYIAGTAFVLLLAVVFMGIALTLFKMFYGNAPSADIKPGEPNVWGCVSIVLLFFVIAVTGFYMPAGVKDLILEAQGIIMG